MPTCPKCGSKGPFRYLENIVCWRKVVGVNEEGHLIVEGLYSTGEGYDTLMPTAIDGNGEVWDVAHPRLECRGIDDAGDGCGHEFTVSEYDYQRIEWR